MAQDGTFRARGQGERSETLNSSVCTIQTSSYKCIYMLWYVAVSLFSEYGEYCDGSKINTRWPKTSSCLLSVPLCSVDDCQDGEREGRQEAVIQAQQHGRYEGYHPDGLREKRKKQKYSTSSITAEGEYLFSSLEREKKQGVFFDFVTYWQYQSSYIMSHISPTYI